MQNLKNKTEQELIDDRLASLELLEELAQAIFLLAVADPMPEHLPKFDSTEWLNAYGISLNANLYLTIAS